MAEFDSLYKCTLGGTGFQLREYGYKEVPIVEDGKGQTGVTLTVTGEGYVEADSAAAFSSALGSASNAFRVAHQSFQLYGLNGELEVTVLAGLCLDGGPFVTFEMMPQSSGSRLVKEFKFTLTAKQAKKSDSDNGDPTNVYKVKVVTGPDGLSQVTVSGELTGPGCADFFNVTVLPKFEHDYPLLYFVPTVTYEGNATDDSATYSLQYTELDEPLPDLILGKAVDGTATESIDVDEQMRKVRVISYDFVCEGDPTLVRDFMRAALKATPFKERYEITSYDHVRIHGELQLLLGANGNALMNWERNLAATERSTNSFDAFEFPGGLPIFVKRPQHGFTYVDSGRAICAGQFMKRPDPLYLTFGADDEYDYEQLNAVEFQTTWKYTYLLDTPIENPSLGKLARPDSPVFLK